ncbi:MAG: NUDIX hydrolase [Nanoarchaeota archaeon]|nr:NUDIX hydrolase [Nanoarchaeota archaeon]MBU1134891.1 NUDIX hydrolase [Nanoarchaeota archaeon]MBU2520395.1 NUDIX hydrolase [Nanoarchaeota archaeon]
MIDDIKNDPHRGKVLPIVRILVFNEKYQCLLLKRKKSPYKEYWEVVGGKINFRESSENASARELLEETGIDSKPMFFDVIEHIDDDYHRILFSFFVKINHSDIKLSEHSEYEWFDVNNLPDKIIPHTRGFIEKASKRISS